MFGWLRQRKSKNALRTALGSQGRLYYLMKYDEEYRELIDSVSPESKKFVLCELFLFRFWCTQFMYRICKPDGISDSDILEDVIPNGLTLGVGMFQKVHGVDVEDALGDELSALMEDRFQKYDQAFTAGRHTDPPFGRESIARALAAEIFHNPPQDTIEYFNRKIAAQIGSTISIWNA